MHCPLCGASGAEFFHRDGQREYLRCVDCQLVYVPPRYFLDLESERAEYSLHENDPADEGYRGFLSRLATPLMERLPGNARGLDFGCGPGPALVAMLREAGHDVSRYDPFFFPDRTPLSRRYDFITATEVVEHLHRPGEELERLWAMLRPGGWLGIMTKLVIDANAFAGWHYKNDLTHVSFFSRDTWTWWGECRDARPVFVGNDVILLRRER
ncbi:MAG: class I SAM-dependent methyltransferase [Halieaceae bacterium]|nr:class I SAM-dependent methyltransferase [Halieaceae bacterium]